jgi:16S rRNA C967 or C1407 C5-methylase (RsmB/RsmF family)
MVIANDADYKRSYMLVHQTKRLQSPCLVVTNHEAQNFPTIFFTTKPKESEKKNQRFIPKVLQFDRILCDVPCSGDGTLRKNKTIWGSWNVTSGNGLHKYVSFKLG